MRQVASIFLLFVAMVVYNRAQSCVGNANNLMPDVTLTLGPGKHSYTYCRALGHTYSFAPSSLKPTDKFLMFRLTADLSGVTVAQRVRATRLSLVRGATRMLDFGPNGSYDVPQWDDAVRKAGEAYPTEYSWFRVSELTTTIRETPTFTFFTIASGDMPVDVEFLTFSSCTDPKVPRNPASSAPLQMRRGEKAHQFVCAGESGYFSFEVEKEKYVSIWFAGDHDVAVSVRGPGGILKEDRESTVEALGVFQKKQGITWVESVRAGTVIVDMRHVKGDTPVFVGLEYEVFDLCDESADTAERKNSANEVRTMTMGQASTSVLCNPADVDTFSLTLTKADRLSLLVELPDVTMGSSKRYVSLLIDVMDKDGKRIAGTSREMFPYTLDIPKAPVGKLTVTVRYYTAEYGTGARYAYVGRVAITPSAAECTLTPETSNSFSGLLSPQGVRVNGEVRTSILQFCADQSPVHTWWFETTAPDHAMSITWWYVPTDVINVAELRFSDNTLIHSWQSSDSSMIGKVIALPQAGRYFLRFARADHATELATDYGVRFYVATCAHTDTPMRTAPLVLNTEGTVRSCASSQSISYNLPQPSPQEITVPVTQTMGRLVSGLYTLHIKSDLRIANSTGRYEIVMYSKEFGGSRLRRTGVDSSTMNRLIPRAATTVDVVVPVLVYSPPGNWPQDATLQFDNFDFSFTYTLRRRASCLENLPESANALFRRENPHLGRPTVEGALAVADEVKGLINKDQNLILCEKTFYHVGRLGSDATVTISVSESDTERYYVATDPHVEPSFTYFLVRASDPTVSVSNVVDIHHGQPNSLREQDFVSTTPDAEDHMLVFVPGKHLFTLTFKMSNIVGFTITVPPIPVTTRGTTPKPTAAGGGSPSGSSDGTDQTRVVVVTNGDGSVMTDVGRSPVTVVSPGKTDGIVVTNSDGSVVTNADGSPATISVDAPSGGTDAPSSRGTNNVDDDDSFVDSPLFGAVVLGAVCVVCFAIGFCVFLFVRRNRNKDNDVPLKPAGTMVPLDGPGSGTMDMSSTDPSFTSVRVSETANIYGNVRGSSTGIYASATPATGTESIYDMVSRENRPSVTEQYGARPPVTNPYNPAPGSSHENEYVAMSPMPSTYYAATPGTNYSAH